MIQSSFQDENLTPIPEFPGYAVGKDGSIWSRWTAHRLGYARGAEQVLGSRWKKLRGEPRKEDGRLRYTLKHESCRYVRKYGSHFVLIAFVGPCPPGMEACHNDGNCLNDASDNLRWDTSVANKADMRKHGTQVHGETHPKAKIPDAAIPRIVELLAAGATYKSIAAIHGVTEQRIFQICQKGKR